jgi:anti-sigma B factor antagonist
MAAAAQTEKTQHFGQNLVAVTEQKNEQCCVTLTGRITIDSSPDLRSFLLRKLAFPRCQVLRVDFGDVTYIDTSGLAVLVELLKAARQSAKRMQISGLREKPRYLLEATRLLHLFEEVSSSRIP